MQAKAFGDVTWPAAHGETSRLQQAGRLGWARCVAAPGCCCCLPRAPLCAGCACTSKPGPRCRRRADAESAGPGREPGGRAVRAQGSLVLPRCWPLSPLPGKRSCRRLLTLHGSAHVMQTSQERWSRACVSTSAPHRCVQRRACLPAAAPPPQMTHPAPGPGILLPHCVQDVPCLHPGCPARHMRARGYRTPPHCTALSPLSTGSGRWTTAPIPPLPTPPRTHPPSGPAVDA